MPVQSEFFQKPAGSSGFYDHQIQQSARFDTDSTSSNASRLTRTFSTVDSNVHFTLNFWIKRAMLGGNLPTGSSRASTWFTPRSGTSGSVLHEFRFADSSSNGDGDALNITNTNTAAYVISTENLLRDVGGWTNIHMQFDLDNGTASEKIKFFINGTETSYNVDNRSSFTSFAGIAAGAWTIGDYYNYGYAADQYLAQWAYVDGTTYAPTVFAESKNGVWIPKNLSSGITWGSAGHLLLFEDANDLGNDSSGNNNDWTSANMTADHQSIDSPTLGTG